MYCKQKDWHMILLLNNDEKNAMWESQSFYLNINMLNLCYVFKWKPNLNFECIFLF